jgi:hypothetical protein
VVCQHTRPLQTIAADALIADKARTPTPTIAPNNLLLDVISGISALGLRALGLRALGLRALGLRALGLRALGLRMQNGAWHARVPGTKILDPPSTYHHEQPFRYKSPKRPRAHACFMRVFYARLLCASKLARLAR